MADTSHQDKIKTILCSNINEVFSNVEGLLLKQHPKTRIAAYQWERLPEVAELIDDVLQVLARISQALWPDWYALEPPLSLEKHMETLDDLLAAGLQSRELVDLKRWVSSGWLKSAITCIRNKALPLPKGYPKAVQARQLALCVDPNHLQIVMGISDPTPSGDRLLGFARAVEWIAKETQTPVVAVVQKAHAASSELASILYDSQEMMDSDSSATDNKTDELEKSLYGPVIGKPHPFSPGEQKLAACLSRDTELHSLFHFNKSIDTVRGNRFLVDLVWEAGKLIVEVDGYSFHSSKTSFRYDRNKDYELTISGYTVLRLPHGDVVNDVNLAVEKVRDVVLFIQKTQTHNKS